MKQALLEKAAITASAAGSVGLVAPSAPSVTSNPVWDLREAFYQTSMARRDNRRYGFPVHIDAKRSWSPAFKQHVADVEQAAVDAFMKRLEEDEAFASKVLKVFGFG